MSLRQITRAALCAALVALCIAGAGWFSMRIVAGRETTPAALHGAAALGRLKQDGQYESLQAAISAARLSVTRVAQTPLGRAAWHAPNRAAGYDAYVTESGVSLALDRETNLSLHLHSLGYGDALQTVGNGVVSGDRQSITIERDNLCEWFVNGANGLEHGFTLAKPPQSATGNRQGTQSAIPLRLALQIGKGWRAVAHEDGMRVSLHNDKGQSVEYGKLSVRDAWGRAIPGKLTIANEQVVIEVADHEASYPLTIDPLFTRGQTLLAEDPLPEACLGQSVALLGDTALVGAPGDNGARGAAYVFVRSGTTSNAVWAIQAKLLASDGKAGDDFGMSVAMSGDTVLIGAPDGTNPAGGNQGVAYVFTRSGTTWTQQRKLFANDGQNDAKFGAAVALDGDTALVGAPFQTTVGTAAGAAYIFTRNGTTWTQQPRLNANDAAAGDQFGAAVALDGDTALIGAPKNTVTFTNQGAAYTFTRNGADWIFQQRVTASSQSAAGDNFGNAVALSGEQAAIGANLKSSDDRGKVFTFRRGATGWGTTSSFEMPVAVAGAHFGTALALRGNKLVVGAALGPNESGTDHRSAYVYTLNGQTWVSVKQLGVGLGSADDHFGYAVALDGNTVLVGVPFADAAANNQGAAYTFVSLDSRHVEQQKLTAIDGAANDEFGNAVALDGDTVAVSVARDDLNKGAVYVFVRSGTGTNAGWTLQQKIIANDGAMGDAFGTSVSLSRDTLVIGAPNVGIDQKPQVGAVYIFTRRISGIAQWALQQKIVPGDRAFSHLGAAVAISGETLVVGVPDFTSVGGTSHGGYAAVYLHTNLGWFKQGPDLVAANDVQGNKFGAAVALDGNTVVIGAPFDKVGLNDGQGSAYVFTRGSAAWSLQKILVAGDGARGDLFGTAVAVKGDTAAVGAPAAKIGTQGNQGAAYFFTRSGTTWVTAQKLFNSTGSAGYQFGSAVGLSDTLLAVGEPFGSDDNSSEGFVHVYTRLGVNMEFQQRLNGRPQVDNVFFGNAVAVSGDTLAVGAYYDDIGVNSNQGSAYIFVAPGCPGLTLAPSTLHNGVVGAAYNQQLTVSGGEGARKFVLAGGSLPSGLSLTSSGLLQGTPMTAGTYRFTLMATSFLSLCSASHSYTLTITENCPTLTLNPATLPDGLVGAAYNQQLTATGGAGPYAFAVTAGVLPSGLTLSGTGALSGTPTATGAFNFTITATDVNGCFGTRTYAVTINGAAANNGLQFFPLPRPIRLLDTRPGQAACDAPGVPLAGGTVRTQTAAGRTCGGVTIPANAKALTGNITTVESGGGYLTLYPSGAAQPLVANSNYAPNEILNNVFTVGLGNTDGALKLFALNSTHVVVDVTGYYAPPAAGGLYFHPLPKPVRLLDTRAGMQGCFTPGSPLPPGSNTPLLGQTVCDGVTLPAGARALVGNVTTVNPQGGGYLALYPADAAQPLVASSNFTLGQTINAPFTVGLAPSGFFNIFTTTQTDLVLDVSGYYSTEAHDVNGQGLLFTALPQPIRLLETRAGFTGCYTPNAPLGAGSTRNQPARGTCSGVTIANDARALVGNATVVGPLTAGYLTFWPSGAVQPLVATSNYQAGQTFNRHFTAGLGVDGVFKLFTVAQTELVIDVTGFFAP